MEIDTQSIQDQIPYYLSQEAKHNLVKALDEFPKNTNYYISLYEDSFLQGDGWKSFELINFVNGERKKVKGIILSNSCDIDIKNKRDIPAKITFAPIIKLNRYSDLLERSGLKNGKIEAKINAIRDQKVTNLFYLPKGNGLDDDYIALLSDLHTIPLDEFQKIDGREKLFTLSQVGFYLFVLKLSVHFCRFHENLARY